MTVFQDAPKHTEWLHYPEAPTTIPRMSIRSRPRKSGDYVGGRPWPIINQSCRNCGGGPPDLFYRARGLCNICYKRLSGTPDIEQYPPLPECCSDSSYRRLQKNPKRWLQREMGGSYASDHEGREVTEAKRIFDLAISRWLGEETPFESSVGPLPLEEFLWADTGCQVENPSLVDEDLRNNKERLRRNSAHRRRVGRLRKLIQKHILKHVELSAKPTIGHVASSSTLEWSLHGYHVCLTSNLHDIFVTIELGQTVLFEADYSSETFSRVIHYVKNFRLR